MVGERSGFGRILGRNESDKQTGPAAPAAPAAGAAAQEGSDAMQGKKGTVPNQLGLSRYAVDIPKAPAAGVPAADAGGAPAADGATPEGSRLIVGRNIHLKGEITACDTLVVEGRVEASMNARVILIAEDGVFSGEAVVDTAEVSGRFEGNLTVRKDLIVRPTGRVSGTVRYGEIEIHRGGRIAGDVHQSDAAAELRAVEGGRPEPVRRPQSVTGGQPAE